jgi:hypothetical protein
MKARTARFGVLVAAVLGLMATMIPSASATTVKEITFVGNATIAGGLGYPVITPPNHYGFTLSSTVCVKESVSTPDKPAPKVGPDLCSITAAGTVWGHCGLSTGAGVVTLENLLLEKATRSLPFTFTGVGGELIVQGGSGNETIIGVVTAVPTTGSCTNKTATGFTIVGTATYVDIT